MEINSYGTALSQQRAGQTDLVGKSSSADSTQKKDGTSLDMQDFLNLLTAQLSNQDVMNPSTDTEFIAQMAQFTSLQAMQTLTELTYAQYGASMIGKKVIVASMDKKGEMITDTGVVSNVKFMSGACSIMVNGKEYDMSSIMEVLDPNSTTKPEVDPPSEEKI